MFVGRSSLRVGWQLLAAALFAVALAAAPGTPATAAQAAGAAATGRDATGATEPDAERLFKAIVKVQVRAVPNARSAASLGREREGTGIVIGADNLILTIGYLIVEADEVTIVDSRGRSLPATIVGYDHGTGLGLVRSVVDLGAAPVALGDPAKLTPHEAVLIVNHEGPGDVTIAQVAARREFTGNWEYLLDQAIFTTPPVMNWSGAALLDRDLQLLGVGSLIVGSTDPRREAEPGNMFVPIDTLKPILADLVRDGRRAGPARPWLGVAADEVRGRLVVARVSSDGPADQAGVDVGDIILAVGGDPVRTQAEFYRKVWARGAAGTDVPLRLLQGAEVKDVSVRSIDRVEYFRPRTMH